MDRIALSKLIGANIRKYRVQRDVSQEHLALESGIHPAYISKLERGEKCPTIDTLYRLARALGIPIYKLIDIDGDIDNISDTAYAFSFLSILFFFAFLRKCVILLVQEQNLYL